jgi:hypothetical protein
MRLRAGSQTARILDLLYTDGGWMLAATVAETLDIAVSSVNPALSSLLRAGLVEFRLPTGVGSTRKLFRPGVEWRSTGIWPGEDEDMVGLPADQGMRGVLRCVICSRPYRDHQGLGPCRGVGV